MSCDRDGVRGVLNLLWILSQVLALSVLLAACCCLCFALERDFLGSMADLANCNLEDGRDTSLWIEVNAAQEK